MKNRLLNKVWKIPTVVALLTLVGLTCALVGEELYWDIGSWICLAIPIYIMITKYYHLKI
ncbi:hypothetical protein SAMN05421877_11723 [Sphingobacterium lactis]|uniref:Uncharacterized protein n=1 Tax=Sphingobacterium lactis TaxID=797291 RepID=A0A1H6CMM1_9SPHI|nr:hypothetical protein SAMN05421877_11723 [Sphingobacterium lactis]